MYVAQRYEHGYEYNAVLFRTSMVREVEKCTVEPSTYLLLLFAARMHTGMATQSVMGLGAR